MKKIMFALTVLGIASASFATSVNWQYTGTAAQDGYMVYALTAMPETISTKDDISSSSSGKVTKNGRVYGATGTLDGFSQSSGSEVDYFLVVVANDGTDDYYFSAAMKGTTYDPTSTDQPVLGKYDASSLAAVGGDGWVKIGTGGGDDPGTGGGDDPGTGGGDDPGTGGGSDVPEPTSGILLMIGGAALALRRRR